MMDALEQLVKDCNELPSQEEVLASEAAGKNSDGTQKPWKWTEDEVKDAKEWINSPVNRVRFLRARWVNYNAPIWSKFHLLTTCIRNWDLKVSSELMISAVSWRRTFQGKGVKNITAQEVQNEIRTFVLLFVKKRGIKFLTYIILVGKLIGDHMISKTGQSLM